IQSHLQTFIDKDVQLIWQTGKTFNRDAGIQADETQGVWCQPFIGDMKMAYGAADVVIARAGAMTIAELKVQHKASILDPYPVAAVDLQTVHDIVLVSNTVGILVMHLEVQETLMSELCSLLTEKRRIEEIDQSLGKEAVERADTIIVREILYNLKS